jgi:cation diffusion facilitator family transporter
MNMRAAVIHLAGDIIQSVGVVIASIIIYLKPEWGIADPICTFIFTFLVLFTTIPIFKDCIVVLMEASPKEIDVAQCY